MQKLKYTKGLLFSIILFVTLFTMPQVLGELTFISPATGTNQSAQIELNVTYINITDVRDHASANTTLFYSFNDGITNTSVAFTSFNQNGSTVRVFLAITAITDFRNVDLTMRLGGGTHFNNSNVTLHGIGIDDATPTLTLFTVSPLKTTIGSTVNINWYFNDSGTGFTYWNVSIDKPGNCGILSYGENTPSQRFDQSNAITLTGQNTTCDGDYNITVSARDYLGFVIYDTETLKVTTADFKDTGVGVDADAGDKDGKLPGIVIIVIIVILAILIANRKK